jgi:murein DD-endopeptidase MepM/ murein hydrolase activator NlpD
MIFRYKKIAFLSAFFVLGLFFVKPALADINQQILDLRSQIDTLTKQAAQYTSNINASQKQADTLAKQINILNNQILQLNTQISITGDQISTAKLEISDLESKIFDDQDKIVKEKSAIGKLIAEMAARDQTSLAAILIKNPTLSNYYDQMQQDTDLDLQLNDTLVLVKKESEDLQNNKTALEEKKNDLETLNDQQVQQKSAVTDTKQSKDQLLTATKGKEQEYQKMLTDVESKQAAFFDQLKKLEAQALATGAFIVHVTATNVPAKGTWSIRWPLDDYIITQGYGMTAYAKRGAYGGAPHNGVDIASAVGSSIHPIDAGSILASGYDDGWGNFVAVVHANNMVSLYGHMKAPSGLANGTPVTKNSVIGYEGATGNTTGAHVHLSIYKDFFTYLNTAHNNQLYFNYFDGTVNPYDYLP